MLPKYSSSHQFVLHIQFLFLLILPIPLMAKAWINENRRIEQEVLRNYDRRHRWSLIRLGLINVKIVQKNLKACQNGIDGCSGPTVPDGQSHWKSGQNFTHKSIHKNYIFSTKNNFAKQDELEGTMLLHGILWSVLHGNCPWHASLY
jgi:hypothetical protein